MFCHYLKLNGIFILIIGDEKEPLRQRKQQLEKVCLVTLCIVKVCNVKCSNKLHMHRMDLIMCIKEFFMNVVILQNLGQRVRPFHIFDFLIVIRMILLKINTQMSTHDF